MVFVRDQSEQFVGVMSSRDLITYPESDQTQTESRDKIKNQAIIGW